MKKNDHQELLFIPKQSSGSFRLKEQYVSFEKDFSKLKKQLNDRDFKKFIEFTTVGRKNLKIAIKQLIDLKNIYPNCCEIYNLLAYLLIRKRQIKKAESITFENYKNNPDNLLAKINYADQLLRKKKLEEVKKVFDSKKDLRDLYPKQKVFPLSEFRGFIVLMGLYHHFQGKIHEAECYHYIATRVDKDNSQVRFLRKKLYHKPFYKKFYDKLTSKLKSC